MTNVRLCYHDRCFDGTASAALFCRFYRERFDYNSEFAFTGITHRPLTEMVKLPLVAKHLGPLLERHRKSIEILRERIEASNGVIFFDVSDMDLEGYNKFIPYLLHPECVYSVSVSASAVRAKVSLGTNPWNQATANQNLASLAEKYGGGGHARVSAISFDPGSLTQAREVARDLAAILRRK